MTFFLFCHLQNQLYLMHKRENPQVTFGGEQMPKFWFVLGHRTYDNLFLWQFHLLTGWDHVLVSDKVSSITSLSYMSHSRVKESRRGVSSIILSWLDSGVSKDVILVSSNFGVARWSPGSDVFSIFISAGVFRLPRTLSLMSVPECIRVTSDIWNNNKLCLLLQLNSSTKKYSNSLINQTNTQTQMSSCVLPI